MSEDQNTQAVVDEADTQPQAGNEVNDARNQGDDLDAVLKEFDTETKPVADSKPEPKPGTDTRQVTQTDPALAEVQNYIFRQDMGKLVEAVRGDLDPNIFDSDTVEAWIDGQARKDSRLTQAWLNRHNNPQQFERVKVELGKSFAKKFSKLPDRQVTDDVSAVTAAVRGASTRAPESKAPDFSKMSPSEFEAAKEKMFG